AFTLRGICPRGDGSVRNGRRPASSAFVHPSNVAGAISAMDARLHRGRALRTTRGLWLSVPQLANERGEFLHLHPFRCEGVPYLMRIGLPQRHTAYHGLRVGDAQPMLQEVMEAQPSRLRAGL